MHLFRHRVFSLGMAFLLALGSGVVAHLARTVSVTDAGFRDSETGGAHEYAAGELDLGAEAIGGLVVALTPGEPVARVVMVSNLGTSPLRYTVDADGFLGNIDLCNEAVIEVAADAVQLFEGNAPSLFVGDRTLALGATEALLFEFSFAGDQDVAAGGACEFTLVFAGRQEGAVLEGFSDIERLGAVISVAEENGDDDDECPDDHPSHPPAPGFPPFPPFPCFPDFPPSPFGGASSHSSANNNNESDAIVEIVGGQDDGAGNETSTDSASTDVEVIIVEQAHDQQTPPEQTLPVDEAPAEEPPAEETVEPAPEPTPEPTPEPGPIPEPAPPEEQQNPE